jgi:hypothetical protein
MVVEIRVVVMTASLRWHAADLPAVSLNVLRKNNQAKWPK